MEPRVLAPLPREHTLGHCDPRCKDKGRVPKLDFTGSLWLEAKDQHLVLGAEAMGKKNVYARV